MLFGLNDFDREFSRHRAEVPTTDPMMNRKLEIPLQEQKNNMTPNLTKEIYDLAKSALMKKIYEVRAYHLGKKIARLYVLVHLVT